MIPEIDQPANEWMKMSSEEEGRRDYDDALLSKSPPGQLAPFLPWSQVAGAAGTMLAQALAPKVFAQGGEVEDEHGPSDPDSGFLSTSKPGAFMPFLQWRNWGNIIKSTADQVVKAGGVEAVAALAGAAAGPAGMAAAAAVSTLTSTVGNVMQQFTGAAESTVQSLRNNAPRPLGTQAPLHTLEAPLEGGANIDRTTTINVLRSGSYGAAPAKDALSNVMQTYLGSIRP
ncbi:hypothetical protein [Nocardia sp. NPDC056100]|uniref:hypothetical protein n=1 Tax=Nocardia sp. NPDC056100 TaxID=3345712 RepID=UPI0035D6C732